MPRRSVPPKRSSRPIAGNPDGAREWRYTPMPAKPHPSAIPNPFAVYPHIVRSGRNADSFHPRRLWGFSDGQRGLGRGDRLGHHGWRLDHAIYDLLADAGVMQLNEVRRSQIIDRMRVANLT